MDRLKDANKVFTEGYTATYTYNPIGNILTKAENGPLLNYAYSDAAHKHAVTHLNTVQNYWYDANGNMTKRIEGGTTYTQTFDAENRLITVTTTSGTTTFVYDGDGNRVKKTENGVTTIYVGALFEKNLTTNVATSYYLANGKPIALRQNTTVSYLHGNHLGSTSLTTDASPASLKSPNGIILPTFSSSSSSFVVRPSSSLNGSPHWHTTGKSLRPG